MSGREEPSPPTLRPGCPGWLGLLRQTLPPARSFHGSRWVPASGMRSSTSPLNGQIAHEPSPDTSRHKCFSAGAFWGDCNEPSSDVTWPLYPGNQEVSRSLWIAPGTALSHLYHPPKSENSCVHGKEKIENRLQGKGFQQQGDLWWSRVEDSWGIQCSICTAEWVHFLLRKSLKIRKERR